MTNKTLGTLLVVSIVGAILTAMIESSASVALTDSLYAIFGLGMIVLGLWAGARLTKI